MRVDLPEILAFTTFPSSPGDGALAFVNGRLYIYLDSESAWIPISNTISYYVHSQGTAATTWTVDHSLGFGTVNVQVFDEDNMVVIPDIEILDNDTVEITFLSPTAGRAVIVAGEPAVGGQPAVAPAFGYLHEETIAATTWVVNHGLGYYPIVHVFDSTGTEVLPTIVHDTKFKTTITFGTATAGTARFL